MKEQIERLCEPLGIGFVLSVGAAGLVSVLFSIFVLFNSCHKEPLPDPILGFWKSTNTDEPYGWAFYSDGQFGRYVELCPEPDSPLKFYWAGNWRKSANGIVLNDTTNWRLDFGRDINTCTVTTPERVFFIKREFWGE